MTKKPNARELPLVRRRIGALLDKTEANGCTPGEATAAFDDVRLNDSGAEAFEAATGRRIGPWTRHRQARRAADRRASRLDLSAHRRGGQRPDRGCEGERKVSQVVREPDAQADSGSPAQASFGVSSAKS